MADDKQQTSALFKRHEQIKRWEESDTNKCIEHTVTKDKRVKFQDGCIFLAACSSGDCDEVKRLLDRGADINTANVDGLTALHQACIDDNLDMVEFLVEHKADVDVCDNEGWTPLHATASCGFTEIARYLLQKGANVAAVNNDGDLPLDICEDHDMEKLLQQAMDEQGVDADAARHEEEDKMMEDANHLLDLCNKHESIPEEKHPKTGATCLHVAAAKGYVKVMNVLIQAGADINAKDIDGWTPLHAAAHWGQEESCKILAENLCDLEAKNLTGQTAFDVADTELVKLLEELKLKQANLKDKQKESPYTQTTKAARRSRNDPARSSVTRMSVEQKRNETMKNVDQEKAPLDAIPVVKEDEKAKSSSSSCSEEEENSVESDTEKKNEMNKKTIQPNQPPDRDKPPLVTTVEIREKQPNKEMPKIEEMVETTEKENLKNLVDANQDIQNDLKMKSDMIGEVLKKDNIFNDDKSQNQKEEQEKLDKSTDKWRTRVIIDDKLNGESFTNKEIVDPEHKEKIIQIIIRDEKQDDKLKTDKLDNYKKVIEVKPIENEMVTNSNKNLTHDDVKKNDITNETPLIEDIAQKKDRDKLKRTESAPPRVTEIPKLSINLRSQKDEIKSENEVPSWRTGLRKTGSTSTVPSQEIANKLNEDDKYLPRSASHPRLAEESSGGNENKKNDNNEKPRRPHLSSSSFTDADHSTGVSERLSGSGTQGLSNPYRFGSSLNSNSTVPLYQSAYVPYYQRRQFENEQKERERNDKEKENVERENVANNRISAPASLQLMSTNVTSTSTSTTSSPTTVNTPTSSFVYFKKPFEPPKRDEETEMLRKVRAKRARETRRSTQGVTLEEVQQANEVLRKSDNPIDPSSTTATATTTTVTTSSLSERNKLSDLTKSQDVTTDSVNKDIVSISDRDSRLTGDVNLRRAHSALDSDSLSISSWRRSREDASKKDDDVITRSNSFRRPRVDKDLSNSAPASSFYSTDLSYMPRNRNALLITDVGNGALVGSGNLTRSASLRADRLRTEEDAGNKLDQIKREKEIEKVSTEASDKGEKDDKRPESAAIRSRRMRKERRSTGIADYTPEDKDNKEEKDKDKENNDESKDDNKTDTDDKSSRYSHRYDSTSDVPTNMSSSRPSAYSDNSRTVPPLDKDYKKLYEEEKAEKEKLKRDLEQYKKELQDSKVELQQIRRNDANRLSDTTDKREKRALERKVSELEEEVKKMDQLKEDNRRLREENGALIRVISKLSK